MLPYFATAGRRLYAKSASNLFEHDQWASEHLPTYFIRTFRMEVHWARRGDCFWAGLYTDWMTEQVLMRSVKMSYGLTQGKRLSGMQQPVWLMSTTPCRHVLQQCCICIYVTTLRTSQSDDILTFLITAMKLLNSIRTPYTLDLINYLSQRDPFSQDHAMCCVA